MKSTENQWVSPKTKDPIKNLTETNLGNQMDSEMTQFKYLLTIWSKGSTILLLSDCITHNLQFDMVTKLW